MPKRTLGNILKRRLVLALILIAVAGVVAFMMIDITPTPPQTGSASPGGSDVQPAY